MIAVVGEALVDVVMAADGAVTARSGGAPFNAARACARLGAPAAARLGAARRGHGVPVGGGDDEAVARAEYDELAALDGPAFGSGGAVTGEPEERR